jgi:hypothetical protein
MHTASSAVHGLQVGILRDYFTISYPDYLTLSYSDYLTLSYPTLSYPNYLTLSYNCNEVPVCSSAP